MMGEHDLMVANADMQPLNYASLPQEIAEQLQRYESDARRYLGDAQRSIFQLAATLKDARDLLSKRHVGFFDAWVQRLYPTISRTTAYKLASIADKAGADYVPDGDVIPAGLTSISAIAAFLSAPEPVQEKVKGGKLPPRRDEIVEATLLYEKAQARIKELEVTLAKQQAEIAGLQAVKDDAQKVVRYAETEMENAQLKLTTLEREMKDRIAAAAETERKTIKQRYDAELLDAQRDYMAWRRKAEEALKETDEKRKKAERDLRDAQRVAAGLAEQLKRSADEGARWARWEITAVRTGKQLEQIKGDIPSDDDVVIFLDGHWKLLDELLEQVDALRAVILERKRRHAGSGIVIDAG
jgi:hypothetical protein